MGYTIKNFICSNKFLGMRLISDNSGINREIRGVRIIVDPNMENFLGGVAPCRTGNIGMYNIISVMLFMDRLIFVRYNYNEITPCETVSSFV